MANCKNGMSFGVGAAIRDDKGLVLAARSNQLPGIFSATNGELIALREGLLLAKFLNLQVDIAEMISPSLAFMLNDSKPLEGESKCQHEKWKEMLGIA